MPLTREIKYPFFLKCLQYTNDNYWKVLFEDLAYDICPISTYISKGLFCCSQSSKEFTYKIPFDDPEKIFKDVTRILKKNNFMSSDDRKIIEDEINEIEIKNKELRNYDWNSIKKKSIKDMLFQNYLIEMKKKYNLKSIQIKKIYNFINLGLLLKHIKNSDITYNNGKIEDIKCITFSHSTNPQNPNGKYKCNLDIDD